MNTLLVDGNNAVATYHFALPQQTCGFGDPVQGIIGLLSELANVKGTYGHVIVVFDSGERSARRLKLFPKYKEGRSHRKELGVASARARHVLDTCGVHTIQIDGVEADDAIATLATRLDGHVVIRSYDKDFFQLISPKISQQWKGKRIRHGDIIGPIERTDAHLYKLFLALKGDGDEAPGVERIGAKTATKIIDALITQSPNLALAFKGPFDGDEIGPFKAWLERNAGVSMRKPYGTILKQWDRFILSMRMVDLHRTDLLTPHQSGELEAALTRVRQVDALAGEVAIEMLGVENPTSLLRAVSKRSATSAPTFNQPALVVLTGNALAAGVVSRIQAGTPFTDTQRTHITTHLTISDLMLALIHEDQ